MKQIEIAGLVIEVVRKAIMRSYLRVYPPDGRVRITVPYLVTEGFVRKMIQAKMDWIKKHQLRLKAIDVVLPMSKEEEQRHRKELNFRILELFEKWQPIMGVKATSWGIKKMKTRWGSCNVRTGKIWINLELARKPSHCLEYIVVHELAHLLEPSHNHRFKAFMDQFLPNWRNHRAELNNKTCGFR
jgi:predicted metal-dependent hydrolase